MVNSLSASRPNPIDVRTVVSYSLAADGPARLDIFSVEGRRVRTLIQATQKAGFHQASWDGTDDGGNPVGAGIYWSRLQVGTWTSDSKMVLLR
jgi:serine protease AprX